MTALILKTEKLLHNSQFSADEQKKWTDFLTHTTDILATQRDLPTPKEYIEKSVLHEHLKRFDTLTTETKLTLENVFSV